MANVWYIDSEGGSDANTFASFAQRGQTLSGLTGGKGLVGGDSVRFMGSSDPVDTGIVGNFVDLTSTITLASSVTTNLYMDGAWDVTGISNVTATTNTASMIEGANCASLAVAVGFTTGKVAFFATGTLDLSQHQQVCMKIRTSIATATNTFRLDLCSDTGGASILHSFTLNRALLANQWTHFTFDNGSLMNSSVKSIALVALLDPGTNTVLLDCFFTTYPSTDVRALTYKTLVGKNTADDKTWNIPRSINDTTLVIDAATNTGTSTGAGLYSGTSEAVTLYKRGTLKTPATALAATVNQTQVTATSPAFITLSGGWNTTDMSTQTLDSTWLDGVDGAGFGISLANANWVGSKINFVRYQDGLRASGNRDRWESDLHIVACSSVPLNLNSASVVHHVFFKNYTCYLVNNSAASQILTNNSSFGDMEVRCSGTTATPGLIISGPNQQYGNIITRAASVGGGHLGFGAAANTAVPSNIEINSLDAKSPTGGTIGAISMNAGSAGSGNSGPIRINSMVCENVGVLCTTGPSATLLIGHLNAVSWNTGLLTAGAQRPHGVIKAVLDTVSASSWLASNNATAPGEPFYVGKTIEFNVATAFSTDNTFVRSTNTASWVFQLSAPAYNSGGTSISSLLPFTPSEPYKIYCNANETLTFSAWVARSNVNDIMIQLRIVGGRINGIADDVVSAAVGSTNNAWEQLLISATPTEAGYIEILPEVYSRVWDTSASFSDTNVRGPRAWIDDISWNTASTLVDYPNTTSALISYPNSNSGMQEYPQGV